MNEIETSVAVVGAGPAGFYAAERLLAADDVEVDLFDRLPTPWGLVRAGVAPDHPKIKQVTKRYEQTAAHPRFRFHGGVEVGGVITHEDLLEHFHAVIYTTGAAIGRRLDIPGEELDGCESATDFVAWYNGHPDGADHHFDLSSHRAVVVGNGNVALDVARMLMLPEAKLRETDVADHALDKLVGGAIREVVILGRRGPAEAAYTTPELRELASFTDATVIVDPQGGSLETPEDAETRVRRNLEVVREYAANEQPADDRTIVLRFLTSPVEVLGDDEVEGLRVVRNELVDGRARPTGERGGSRRAVWSSPRSAIAASRSRACRSTTRRARSPTTTAASPIGSTPRAGPSVGRRGSSAPTRSARTRRWRRCWQTARPAGCA